MEFGNIKSFFPFQVSDSVYEDKTCMSAAPFMSSTVLQVSSYLQCHDPLHDVLGFPGTHFVASHDNAVMSLYFADPVSEASEPRRRGAKVENHATDSLSVSPRGCETRKDWVVSKRAVQPEQDKR